MRGTEISNKTKELRPKGIQNYKNTVVKILTFQFESFTHIRRESIKIERKALDPTDGCGACVENTFVPRAYFLKSNY